MEKSSNLDELIDAIYTLASLIDKLFIIIFVYYQFRERTNLPFLVCLFLPIYITAKASEFSQSQESQIKSWVGSLYMDAVNLILLAHFFIMFLNFTPIAVFENLTVAFGLILSAISIVFIEIRFLHPWGLDSISGRNKKYKEDIDIRRNNTKTLYNSVLNSGVYNPQASVFKTAYEEIISECDYLDVLIETDPTSNEKVPRINALHKNSDAFKRMCENFMAANAGRTGNQSANNTGNTGKTDYAGSNTGSNTKNTGNAGYAGNTNSQAKRASESVYFNGCTDEESIKARYKSLCKVYHPDNNNGDTKTFMEIKKEYEALLAR